MFTSAKEYLTLVNEHHTLKTQMAAMKEDIKTLVLANEHEAAYDLFIHQTRHLLGHQAELPKNFKCRSAEEIKAALRFDRECDY
ncbi:hypothetical protein FWP33_07465 [Vibrio parahaemolyticus]|nr:hypothetical protein [Vibrio parahaemolyticus]